MELLPDKCECGCAQCDLGSHCGNAANGCLVYEPKGEDPPE